MGMCMGPMQPKSNLHWIAGKVSLPSLMRSSGQERIEVSEAPHW